MHPGRGATQIGNDRIPISVLVPRWLAEKVRQALALKGVSFSVREGYAQVSLPQGKGYEDLFTFPELAGPGVRGKERLSAAERVRRILASIPEARPGREC